jgi:hypothetical protein
VKAKPEPKAILKQIADIPRMERGKLCRMGSGGHYNHQTWETGRNIVRYVPRERVGELQNAIAGYQQYVKLTKAYADEIIRRTRLSEPDKSSDLARPKRRKMPKSPLKS